MGVEVKGEQGLRKLPEEGLENDRWQVQLIVLVEVHRQPWGWGGEELGRAWRPAANPEAKQAPQPDFTLGHKPPPPTGTGGTGSGHLGSGAPEHTPQLFLASE